MAVSFTLGCSSIAYRSYSCKETTDLFGYSLIGGVIFQIGDCAPFKNFHFETGQYYRSHKEQIDWEVQTYDPKLKYTREVLEKFATSYNCLKGSFKAFSDLLYNNQERIFSKNYDNSSRNVSLNIIRLIEQDPLLSKNCL